MKYIFSLVVCVLVSVIYCNGQQLSPQTINNAGQFRSAGSIQLEDALGGLIVNTITTGSFMYTQDFLQPDNGTTTTVPPINNVQLSGGWTLDNAGTTFVNGNIMLEFTSGEVASITLNSASNMLTQGILQPYPLTSPLPVTLLEFTAKRISASQVLLNWKTAQELNNKGFGVERKKENEADFNRVGFVQSLAAGGNSTSTLMYDHTDTNSFRGITYYRLKQEDLDGQFKYSVVRLVKGGEGSQTVMQVWPVPSSGPVHVMVNGLKEPDQLLVFDAGGKMLQQLTVKNNQQVDLGNLRSGIYILRLAKTPDLLQKIVIQ